MIRPGLLAGLRVLEVSSFVAAPLGGMTLAQLGADVIRIDPVGGAADRTRWPRAGDVSLYWAGLNKGKRSLEIDVRSGEGRDLIRRLVAALPPASGVFITNAVGQPWLGHAALSHLCPDLIHLHVQGKGSGEPAVDYTVNAEMGFPMVTGPAGHAEPVNHVLPAWDIACGLYAAVAVLAADRERRTTGTGRQLTVALHDVALAMAGNLGFLAEAQLGAAPRPRIGNHLYGGFARDFASRDGARFMIVALTARHWRDLLDVTGCVDAAEALERATGADFAREDDRFAYREVLAGLLARWFETHDAKDVESALAPTAIIWSRYRSFHDVVRQIEASSRPNPMLATIAQPGVGEFIVPSSPISIDGSFATPEPAPRLGHDNSMVLSEVLGLSEQGIDDLVRRGVIGASA